MKLLLSIVLLLITSQMMFPQGGTKKYHAFSGTTLITLEGGLDISNTDYSTPRLDYLAKAHLEYFFPTFTKSSFGIRLNGGTGFISGKGYNDKFSGVVKPDSLFRTDVNSFGVGLIYTLSIKDVIFPYIAADVEKVWFSPKNESGFELVLNPAGDFTKSEVNFGGEIGMRFLVTENLSLNISGGVQLSPRDYLDAHVRNANNDMFYFSTIGISYAFFSDRDSDSDGVPDSRDKCNDTPPGLSVDDFGCPLDSDGDGVPDFRDKCPHTLKNVKVDASGCPLDSDKDGVPDFSDLCPDTPLGVQVDDLGCPFDHDGDGVPDYMDKCPGTPHNVEIDRNGCPIDTDVDGVPDYKDLCPNTTIGTEVDTNGCPLIKEEEKKPEVKEEVEIPQLKEITLYSDKAFLKNGELSMEGKSELDRLIFVMKAEPLSRWMIEGYTDNPGKVKDEILIRKAYAWTIQVLNYFIQNNIPKGRFEIESYGRKFPIGDNKTESGRAKNRRVVIKRVN